MKVSLSLVIKCRDELKFYERWEKKCIAREFLSL